MNSFAAIPAGAVKHGPDLFSRPRIFRSLLLGFACAVLLPKSVFGNALLFDFGSTIMTNNANATNAPYSEAGWTTSSWNVVGGSYDFSATQPTLHYSDGSTATGVTIDLATVVNSTTVNFSVNPTYSSSTGGTKGSAGGPFYAGTSVNASLAGPAQDFIFTGASGTADTLALSIGGLTAGHYEVYLAGGNVANAGFGSTGGLPEGFWAGTLSSTPASLNLTNLGTAAISQNNKLDAWAAGENYVKISVDLAVGDYLIVGVTGMNSITGASSTEQRAFLNSLIIVPEPSTSALLLFGACALAFVVRKSRRSVVPS